MKTAQDIVAEIEALGTRLSSLETNQTSNLNLNLGLSNLGLVHQDPKFQNANKNKLNINNTSPAFANGNAAYLIVKDILGNTRSLPPDLGAYKNAPFPIVP